MVRMVKGVCMRVYSEYFDNYTGEIYFSEMQADKFIDIVRDNYAKYFVVMFANEVNNKVTYEGNKAYSNQEIIRVVEESLEKMGVVE